jgi:hypothetical protein
VKIEQILFQVKILRLLTFNLCVTVFADLWFGGREQGGSASPSSSIHPEL